jgi:hypothetical protein
MPLRVVHKAIFSTEALRTTLGGNSKNHLEALYDVKTEKCHIYPLFLWSLPVSSQIFNFLKNTFSLTPQNSLDHSPSKFSIFSV